MALPPVHGEVPCQGERHDVLFQDGELRLLAHEDERLETFRALAGQLSICDRVRSLWDQMCLPVSSTAGADFYSAMLLHERDADEHRPLRTYVDRTGPDLDSLIDHSVREGDDEHVQTLRELRDDASRRLVLLSMSEPLRLAFCLTSGLLTVAAQAPGSGGEAASRARYALADALLGLRDACSSPSPVDTCVLEELSTSLRRYVWSLG